MAAKMMEPKLRKNRKTSKLYLEIVRAPRGSRTGRSITSFNLTNNRKKELLMRSARYLMIAALPLFALGACASLSDEDRATLNAAAENAKAAKDEAAQANSTAQQALQAAQAEADAKAANEKADRMFQKSLRKK